MVTTDSIKPLEQKRRQERLAGTAPSLPITDIQKGVKEAYGQAVLDFRGKAGENLYHAETLKTKVIPYLQTIYIKQLEEMEELSKLLANLKPNGDPVLAERIQSQKEELSYKFNKLTHPKAKGADLNKPVTTADIQVAIKGVYGDIGMKMQTIRDYAARAMKFYAQADAIQKTSKAPTFMALNINRGQQEQPPNSPAPASVNYVIVKEGETTSTIQVSGKPKKPVQSAEAKGPIRTSSLESAVTEELNRTSLLPKAQSVET